MEEVKKIEDLSIGNVTSVAPDSSAVFQEEGRQLEAIEKDALDLNKMKME